MWRFVQLSDPHLGSQTDGRWNNNFLCTMMPDVMTCLRKDLAALNPDFILATGDVVSEQTRDAVYAARDLMDSLNLPYYPMGGNHDFLTEASRKWFLEAFESRLPNGKPSYSFTHKNLHFCVMDAWWKWSDGTLAPSAEQGSNSKGAMETEDSEWAVPPHELAWLEEDLHKHRRSPTVIAIHYPLIDIPLRLRRPGMQNAGHLANGGLMLEVISAFPQVKAVFSGHVHMHFIERNSHLTHVVTGALPEFPSEYREVQVYEDRLEVLTHGLSDTTFAKRSLVPGKEWTRGEHGDRTAVIPF